VLLDEVDRELEKRGHAFARYADDCNGYVRSKRAGEDVLQTLRRLYARLRLQVNEAKSAVARPWDRKFLGYSFWVGSGRQVKRRVAPAALAAMKGRVRELTGRSRGCSVTTMVAELRGYLLGWKAYFRLADTPGVFTASTSGFVTGCAWSTSSSGSEGRRPSGSCELGVFPRSWPPRQRLTLVAGGGRPPTRRSTSLCPVASSIVLACRGWQVDLNLSEPPDTDPYVRWRGRGVVGRFPATPYPI